MSGDPTTVDELRRCYAAALRASLKTSNPVMVHACVAVAAEIRVALGEAGVVDPAQPAAAPVEAVSPWRPGTMDPPTANEVVLCHWRGDTFGLGTCLGDGKWVGRDGPVMTPIRWMPL